MITALADLPFGNLEKKTDLLHNFEVKCLLSSALKYSGTSRFIAVSGILLEGFLRMLCT